MPGRQTIRGILQAWPRIPKWPAQSDGWLHTAAVERGILEDTITATGTLQPKDFVDVGMQVSGQLKKLLVDVGAVAEAGRLHAEIDPSVYQEAKVDGDRAQLVLAELQFTRQENVAREDATTTDALQSAGAAR